MRFPTIRIPRQYRRAILIYLFTLVLPAGVLLWLGVESFDRQREALATLRAEKLAAAVEARLRAEADLALRSSAHSLADYRFVYRDGRLVKPSLDSPLPAPLPAALSEADRLEFSHPERALALYRQLAQRGSHPALAMSRIARMQARLGKQDAAAGTWRALARQYPDERDLSGRPYGIVAAIQAGATDGLLDQIAGGRWELTAEQAEHFVGQLGGGATDYLRQYAFARELSAAFRPPALMTPGELRSESVNGRRIFYRAESNGSVAGIAVSEPRAAALAAAVQSELGIGSEGARDLRIHAGAVALVSLLILGGVVLLARDTSRESRLHQMRTDFVSGVSHELKTPITLVRLYGETLLRHDLPDTERREFYRIITRESTRLGRLVDQILAFARIERGELKYELREGDLAPVVAGVVEDYRDWLAHAGFVLEADIPEAAPPVAFDPAAVSQAVVNLLDNAAKYSGDSRAIEVRMAVEGQQVVIDVRDQGVGIPASEQSRIFDRFYRAAAGSGKGGYGLGLFMVRHIMSVHRGRVEVESAPGQGSRFRLVFPTVAA